MERLYPRVFGVGRDLVEDKVLQAQVATLSFVTPAHLGLQPATCEGPRWHAAIAALRRMGGAKAPLDKVANPNPNPNPNPGAPGYARGPAQRYRGLAAHDAPVRPRDLQRRRRAERRVRRRAGWAQRDAPPPTKVAPSYT